MADILVPAHLDGQDVELLLKDVGDGYAWASVPVDSAGVAGSPALGAGEAHIGQVGAHTAIVSLIFTPDTSALASGDLIADTQEVLSALRVTNGTGILQSLTINDKSDQGVAMKVVLLSANRTLGTENSAPTITDDHGDDILGIIPISASDWLDLGGTRVASIRNIGLPIKAVSGGTSIYAALVNDTGTPTYAANALVARFGILQD